MAEITWSGAVTEGFNTAGNRSSDTVPGMADDAAIGTNMAGTPAMVTTSASDTMNSLSMVATASLSECCSF
jgi:hypothetical protein